MFKSRQIWKVPFLNLGTKFKKEEKMKRYFSFFGILMATSNVKLNMFYSKFDNYLEKLPNIKNSLIKTELKPIKQYSTNNL